MPSPESPSAERGAFRDALDAVSPPRSPYTLVVSLASSGLLFAAQPPLGWWPLAWIAPIGWLLLVRRPLVAGRRPYAALWLAGFAYWFAVLHWLRLPHPATAIGWVALSFYLGAYLPLFVGISRVAVHRLGISAIVAAPVVWTGLEYAQAHLLSGFNMASLGQTQYRWIELIQISDLGGGYAVGFLVMFVAACLARMWPLGETRRPTWWPAAPATAALALALAYGYARREPAPDGPRINVALVQGSIDTEMKADRARVNQIHEQYVDLSRQAVERSRQLDLIVWPETMYRNPICSYTPDARAPEGEAWTLEDLERFSRDNDAELAGLTRYLATPLLLGVDTWRFGPGKMNRANSAVLVDRDGRIAAHYDKMHPVMFGEYIPLANIVPWLYTLTPLASGIVAGERPVAMRVGDVRLAPSICYESILPHLIRRQVIELQAQDQAPDVLVNLTNDGWFWGSSELDLHLACGVFRAVECRKPFLIAANTGFSAVIDSSGRILQQGRRRDTDVLVASVGRDARTSAYLAIGDAPALLCLAATGAVAGVGLAGAWRRRRGGAEYVRADSART